MNSHCLQFRHDLVVTMFPVTEIFKQEYYWSAPTRRNAIAERQTRSLGHIFPNAVLPPLKPRRRSWIRLISNRLFYAGVDIIALGGIHMS